ncbi:MAG: NAD(P)/FAD-dependent oxidoreductase [Thermoproteota archaeon]
MTNELPVFDLIIVGAGPAGITAAVYAARKKIDFMVVTTDIGGQAAMASMIEDYTGFQYITSEDLADKFENHREKYSFKLKKEEVIRVQKKHGLFSVKTTGNTYPGETVLIATGRKPKELNVPGESELKGRGLTYCATCDAPLYEGLDVAVVGGGESGLEAALQLTKIADKIHIIDSEPQLKVGEAIAEKIKSSDKVKIWASAEVREIQGDNTVTGVKIEKEGKETLLPVQGVFIEIGSVANSSMVDFVEKNREGEIMVDYRCETNIPGLFAAGDVTNVPHKQIVVAAGEGCKASLSAFSYLSKK